MSKHVFSENLSDEERQYCVDQLREKNTILSMGVVQFYKTNPPDHKEWEEMGAGALMFIKDSSLRSFFIKYISLSIKEIMFEQKVFKQMKLEKPTEMFFTVEGEDSILGIMFSFKAEYELFNELMSKYTKKIKKLVEQTEKPPKSVAKPAGKKQTFFNKLMDRKKKPTPEKISISAPTNFRQIAHVGVDGLTVFDDQEDSSKWNQLASMLLGSDVDEKTSKEMINFVNNNGGIDKFIKAAERKTKKVKQYNPKSSPKQELTNLDSSLLPTPPPPGPPPPGPPGLPPKSSPFPAKNSGNIPSSSAKPESEKVDLLSQIQQGKSLKKVEIVEDDSDDETEGILGALAQNLANFRQKMNIGDDSDDQEEEDEWSD